METDSNGVDSEVGEIASANTTKAETRRSRIDNHRLRLWLGFWKFFMGTVLLGLVGHFANTAIRDRELTLEEQKHIAQFIEYALDKSTANRVLFAQYFAKVSPSDDARKRWGEYLTVARKDYSDTKSEVKEREDDYASLRKEIDRLEQDREANLNVIQEKEIELRKLAQRINELEKQLKVVPIDSAGIGTHLFGEALFGE